MKLTLFDLDHTLLNGDSDVLWGEFLVAKGLVEKESFEARNLDMATRYKAGTVGLKEFADFYVGTLGSQPKAAWEPLRQEFFANWIVPRITAGAIALVDKHLEAGDLVVMTTATNRYITELTAIYFDIKHLIATEPEMIDGNFTGQTTGTLNMREGKVTRLNEWLSARGLQFKDYKTTAYSDSINDLSLLEAVKNPITVNADSQLAAIAAQRGWPALQLR